MSVVTLLIVDDHPVFRQGLRDVLETDSQMSVIGEAADGDLAIDLATQLNPDVILMDINLPTINGLEVTQHLKGILPAVKVVVLTGYDDVEQIFQALRAGAYAYCPKDITPENLIDTVLAVQEGHYVIEGSQMDYDQMTTWLEKRSGLPIDLVETPEVKTHSYNPLSRREMQILEQLTKGLSNKEISYKLGISHQTVKNHVTAILRKLQVEDRTQAAVYALGRGWVHLKDSN